MIYERQIVDLEAAAKLLGYKSASALKRLARRNELPGAFKVGKFWRLNVDRFLEGTKGK